jgi:tetratricopeptide (TPR) repeat protein
MLSVLLLLVLAACLVEAQSSRSADSYFRRAKLRLAQGDLDGAIRDFDVALIFDPHLADAYTNRGVARYKKGDFAAAVRDFDEALEINPRAAIAYNGRGKRATGGKRC